MKIVVVISTLRYGGAQRVVSCLTRKWAKDHDVTLAVFDKSKQKFAYGASVVELRSMASEHLWGKAFKLVVRSVRLALLFRAEQPDRIISFMESANFPSVIAAIVTRSWRRLRVSVRVDPASMSTIHRLLIPWCYRWADHVIAVSSGVRMALIAMGVPAERASTIPNPVVTPEPRGRVGSGRPGWRFILGVGRLHAQKGFDRLIRAFAGLSFAELHLVILGDGPERGRLAKLAWERGVVGRCHLEGTVMDVGRWYEHAECFVLSSRYEGWPNVIGEAMANGCPVVSYDCRYGPSEIIEHEKSGLLVADGDVGRLTAAITRVVSDDALRGRLALGGRERVRTFAVEKIAPQWIGDVPGVGVRCPEQAVRCAR